MPLPHIDLDDWTKPQLTLLAVEDWDDTPCEFRKRRRWDETVTIDLTPDHAITREWYTLGAERQGPSRKEVSGEVNVVMQWRYNPDLDYDPFSVSLSIIRTRKPMN